MERAHRERARTLREWRKAIWYIFELSREQDLNSEKNRRWRQPNRFRKKDFLDCGKPRCFTCHSDKLMNDPPLQEIIARQRFKEQLAELNE